MASSLATLVVIVALCFGSANAQLTPTFYDKSCPNALFLIKSGIKKALASEKRLGASLLRLHFHDCFAQGCDGSILLDGSSGEKTAGPNTHSARGFNVIDDIKSQVEAACTGIVSCADILAVAARDSVVELGGPTWKVPLGRRDSKTSNLNAANNNIPAPTSTLGNLTSRFQAQGLSTKDMVALSGAHTIGQARCTVFRGRIYNDSNIDSTYAKSLQANCPSGKSGNRNLAPMEDVSPTVFDNNYYKNLRKKKGLLHSDQELFNGGSTDSLVTTYSTSQSTFFNDFAAAMVNMGNINPLTGSSGEIRKNCRKSN